MLAPSLRLLASRAPARGSATTLRALSTSLSAEAGSPAELIETMDEAEVRTELSKLRDSENELMSALKRDPVEIDWAHWKSQIAYPGLVDDLQKEYETEVESDIEADIEGAEKEINSLFDPIIAQYDKMATEAEQDTIEIEKQLADVTFIRDNIKDLSLEEFFNKYPKIKENIEKDIIENKWFVE